MTTIHRSKGGRVICPYCKLFVHPEDSPGGLLFRCKCGWTYKE